jgi:two-component system chemotaxis response regulator CheB
MPNRNIIVIGASAGGFEAIQALVKELPSGLDASIFIVWHMAPEIRGVMPQVLNRYNTLPAVNAVDGQPIEPGRIYVAPPDHHMVLEEGRIRITHGPKENRFRPAVDPLFRSAAQAYGNRVIGIILSGALDDGTSGLWTIKSRGGLAIVQHPDDAAVSSMPESALRAVAVDYTVPVAEMPALLVRLCAEPIPEINIEVVMEENEKTKREVRIAIMDEGLENGIQQFGELSPYACPECHGVLSALKDGNRVRFRCHTGHAYSVDSLMASLTEKIEDSLWNAIRGVEETIILLNHAGDHLAEVNEPRLAARYFQKATEARDRLLMLRKAVLSHEQLTMDSIAHNEEDFQQL